MVIQQTLCQRRGLDFLKKKRGNALYALAVRLNSFLLLRQQFCGQSAVIVKRRQGISCYARNDVTSAPFDFAQGALRRSSLSGVEESAAKGRKTPAIGCLPLIACLALLT